MTDRAMKRRAGPTPFGFWRTRLLLGAAVGVLVLHPSSMVVAWLEHPDADLGLFEFLFSAWARPSVGAVTMTGVFAALGAAVGFGFAVHERAREQQRRTIGELTRELGQEVLALIESGESSRLELKSTARWDLRQGKTNKAMEHAIAKTLAALLNHEGGSLIVGVADDGTTVGLERDYQTLKHKNRDGFAQFIMGLVKSRLGGDVCGLLHLAFALVDGHDVCRIVVEPAHRPIFVRDGGKALYFVRAGPTTRELDAQEAVAHTAMRWPGSSRRRG